jgi:hypothetical protein
MSYFEIDPRRIKHHIEVLEEIERLEQLDAKATKEAVIHYRAAVCFGQPAELGEQLAQEQQGGEGGIALEHMTSVCAGARSNQARFWSATDAERTTVAASRPASAGTQHRCKSVQH